MISSLLILISNYMEAFGYEPFIKDIMLMSLNALLEGIVIDIPIICLIAWRATNGNNK